MTETARLLEKIMPFVRRYVVVGDDELVALALWVCHTHSFPAFEVTPYVSVTSAVPGCGKSLLLEVLEPLVARGWKTGGITAAVLTRKVDKLTPTLLLDETDQAFKRDKEYAAAIQGVLNEGYRKRGVYSLCIPTKGGGWDFADLKVYSPKCFAGIGKLPDTVASRSIVVRLKMRTADEHVEPKYEEDLWTRAEPLHQALVAWASHHLETLRDARPPVPDQLQNRTAEVWRPLFAIADLAGGAWSESARKAALALSGASRVTDDTLNVELLADIRRVFDQEGSERIFTADLIRALAGKEEGAWSKWWDEREGKVASGAARRLANRLAGFEIEPKEIRVGERTGRGYERRAFTDAWARLLPHPPDLSETSDTSQYSRQKTPFSSRNENAPVSDSEEGAKPHEQSDVTDVSARNGGWGASDPEDEEIERLEALFRETAP